MVAYDPAAVQNAQAIFPKEVKYAKDKLQCIGRADCCIVVTEWDEFKEISAQSFLKRMKKPVVINGRRVYNAEEFSKAGVRFFAIGLGPTV